MAMDLTPYKIDHEQIDLTVALHKWTWLLPPDSKVWLMNRFSEIFFINKDGSIQLLHTDSGEVEKVASSESEFYQLIETQENVNSWFMIPLVDKLQDSGIILNSGECYSFIQLPMLGGEYSIKNITIRQIENNLIGLSDLLFKLKSVPDGSKISLRVVP